MDFCPRYDTFWPCGLFTLLQFCKHPPPKSIWNPDENLNSGDIFKECFWTFYHHIEINDSFLNNTTYQCWFQIFLPVIFKYTIKAPCLSNHALLQQIHKVTGAQSIVIYMSKFYRQKLVTNAHLEIGHYLKCHISRRNMVSQAWHTVTNQRLVVRTFGLDIGIVGTVSVWRCCECEANSFEKFDKTANMTSILKEVDQS